MLKMEQNTEVRDALDRFDDTCCSLEELCTFEYRLERQGEHQRQLLLIKQAGSKPHLLNQDIREVGPCFAFKQLGYQVAEKILTLFVKRQIFLLKSDLSERLLSAF